MLDRVTIQKLQELIRTNLDSCKILTEGCHRLSSTATADELKRVASGFDQNAEDLQRLVSDQNIDPVTTGTTDGSFRSLWPDARVAFESGDTALLLAEFERIADKVKRAYEECIISTRGLSELLPKQYARVRCACNALQVMRIQQSVG